MKLSPNGRCLGLMCGAVLAIVAVQPSRAQAPGTVKWVFKAGGRVDSSPALGLDGAILFKASDGQVYSLTSAGGLKWKRVVGSGPIAKHSSSPAIGSDGTVFVGGGTDAGGGGYFYALNPADGSVKWASLGGTAYIEGGPITSRHPDTFHSPALGLDGQVFVSSQIGRVYVFGTDGSLLRETSSSNNSPRIPTIDSQGIPYVCQSSVPEGTGTFGLARLRPDGTPARFVTISTNRTDPCEGTRVSTGHDGTLYVVSRVTSLWAFTPDAKLKWKLPFNVSQAPAVGADGTLFALSGVSTVDSGATTRLHAISTAGTQLWSLDLARADWPGQYTPAIDSNGIVYAGSSLWLFAVTPDGKVKWQFQTSSPITTSPLIDGSGTIYVGTFDGNLYALHGDSNGLTSSSWPMFNADARHTGQGRALTPLVFGNPAECLFNWAERSYSSLFKPALPESFNSPPYYYRSYSATVAFLGTSTQDQHVYYLGPLSNDTVLDVGPLASWLALAGCAATPAQ